MASSSGLLFSTGSSSYKHPRSVYSSPHSCHSSLEHGSPWPGHSPNPGQISPHLTLTVCIRQITAFPIRKACRVLMALEENQCSHDYLQALATPPLNLISKYHCFHSLKPLIHKDAMLAPTCGLCLLSLSLIFHVIDQITFSHKTLLLDCRPLIPPMARHHHHHCHSTIILYVIRDSIY